jgi:hypothetical protein
MKSSGRREVSVTVNGVEEQAERRKDFIENGILFFSNDLFFEEFSIMEDNSR